MFVEDAVSAQGPIVVEVNPAITVAELKIQIEAEFEIPVDVQKWILGKQLVGEESVTLESQGVTSDGAEIYLYLVNPGEKQEEEKPTSPATAPVKIPLVLPTEPNEKGRYWNYEEDRWSFCHSDEDEERAGEVKTPAKAEEGGEKNDDEEWEYYYDDVNVVVKEEAPAGWECPLCTLLNPLDRPGCLACTTDRPANLGAAAGQLEQKQEEEEKEEEKKAGGNLEAYRQLENLDIIPNADNFECTICYLDTEPGDGVVLRECLHTFCK